METSLIGEVSSSACFQLKSFLFSVAVLDPRTVPNILRYPLDLRQHMRCARRLLDHGSVASRSSGDTVVGRGQGRFALSAFN